MLQDIILTKRRLILLVIGVDAPVQTTASDDGTRIVIGALRDPHRNRFLCQIANEQ